MVKKKADKRRCGWCTRDAVYIRYHDREWGVPVHSDRRLFEFLILEGAQAGLSWLTILKKRPAYRQAFDNFNFNKIANYRESKIQSLLANPGIVRNEMKIRAAVNNARALLRLRREFGTFNRYLWSYVNGEPVRNHWRTQKQLPDKTELSDLISKDMKKRGFAFFGSTICYAFMQAVGMVNDHTTNCFRYDEI